VKQVFLSIVVLVNLDQATAFIEHPQVAFKAPVVIGKPGTPTPEGVYVLEKAYSSQLGTNMLVFKRDESGVYAIHPNLESRTNQINSETTKDNRLSAGCIGMRQKEFDKLWQQKQTMILQVYGGAK
jgi:L,D-transpeptidase catalytic domain